MPAGESIRTNVLFHTPHPRALALAHGSLLSRFLFNWNSVISFVRFRIVLVAAAVYTTSVILILSTIYLFIWHSLYIPPNHNFNFQMNSRDDPEKTFKVALPDNNHATVYVRDAMSVEEFLANACARKNLNPMEHFVRVKKRRDMEDHNYFVPHRNDLIETYVSEIGVCSYFYVSFSSIIRLLVVFFFYFIYLFICCSWLYFPMSSLEDCDFDWLHFHFVYICVVCEF